MQDTDSEAGKSQIFDPVTSLQCCNNGSVQKGRMMLILCAHLRKQNQFREEGGSYINIDLEFHGCISLNASHHYYPFNTKSALVLKHTGFLELWCYRQNRPAFPPVLSGIIVIKNVIYDNLFQLLFCCYTFIHSFTFPLSSYPVEGFRGAGAYPS